ncbi:MAG: MFS transporter [Saprospiraceae bacterium]
MKEAAVSKQNLYSRDFLLLCASHVLFAASFSMIIPELPAYLESMGGADYKGLIIALFTLTAGISRPFSGKLTDTVGRIPVMVIGTLVCVVCSLLYPILTTVAGFLLLRLFHGFSTGFKPTASTAFVADIVPWQRRGEAMGIMGVSMNAGASMAPPIGSMIANHYGINAMFFLSSGFALISILILLGLKETLEKKESFRFSLLKIKPNEIIDHSAIAPAIVTVMIYFCYGVILTIVPDQSTFLGLENKGLFLASFTAFSILSRLVSGRVSDRIGRVPVIIFSIFLIGGALVFLGMASSGWMLLAGTGLLGFSVGTAAPTVFAWTIDRADDEHRGRALATVYIALEIGIGGGAILSAWLYDNNPQHFLFTMVVTAIFTVLAIPYLLFWKRKQRTLDV